MHSIRHSTEYIEGERFRLNLCETLVTWMQEELHFYIDSIVVLMIKLAITKKFFFFFFFQGKFIRINFDVTGYIVGANIETCILLHATLLSNPSFPICFAFNPRIHWNAVKGYHTSTCLWQHPSLPLFQNRDQISESQRASSCSETGYPKV